MIHRRLGHLPPAPNTPDHMAIEPCFQDPTPLEPEGSYVSSGSISGKPRLKDFDEDMMKQQYYLPQTADPSYRLC